METDQHQENIYRSRQHVLSTRRAIFIDLDLDRVTRNKKAMYFTEVMKFLAFRPQHFVLWAQASVYEKFIIPR